MGVDVTSHSYELDHSDYLKSLYLHIWECVILLPLSENCPVKIATFFFWMCELRTVICYSNNSKFKVCSSNTLFSFFFSQPAVILEDFWLILFASCHTCQISRRRRNLSELLSHSMEAQNSHFGFILQKKELSKHQLCCLSGCSTCQNELVKMIHNQYIITLLINY